MNKTILTLAIAAVLSGCAAVKPMQHDESKPASSGAAAQAASIPEDWNDPAVVAEGKSSVVLMTPQSIPDVLRNRRVTMELDPGATVNDMVAVLGKLGVTVIISDQEAGKKDFYLPRFNGTLGGLLSAITKVTDVWFTWHDGAVVVSSTERIGISVPQESNFGETLTKGLDGIGVKEKAVNWQSGMAMLEVTPSQFRRVRTYLERYTANAAVVTLQVAVVNVTLNQSVKQGIDWDKLQVSALHGGNVTDYKNWQTLANPTTGTGTTVNSGTTSTGSTGTTGTGTTTGTDTSTALAALPRAVGAVGWAGNALSGAIFAGRFSFQGLFNYLQTYGTAETKQNVMLKTVAGNKVEFKSLMQIPYVSEIGVTTTGTTTTSTASTSTASTGTSGLNNAMGSTKTAKADDGITVELTPTFDAAANSVTIDMKLAIKAVVAFNELSAGNQLGKLTQPTTAERSFTDTLRLRPGQTVVVGGLTYDSVSDNKGAPVFLSGSKLESQSLTVNRQTMFIVVRPTVMKLGQVMASESGGTTLDLLPSGQYQAEPEEEKTPTPKKKAKAGKGEQK